MDENQGWTTIASSDQVTESVAKEVIVGELIVAVFRHRGALYAIDGMCSHQGGPIAEGRVENGCVTCPWHGWQYELATGIQTINRQPLQRTFEIRERDGEIQIQLD